MVKPWDADVLCAVCERGYVYSDPEIYEFGEGNPRIGICRGCYMAIHFPAKNE